MEIIQANSSHKKIVIDLLDEFICLCYKIIKSDKTLPKRENYENIVFNDIINSSKSAIFLAKNGDEFIGILTIHKISLLRWGKYKYAEIEEMFVQEKYQGSEAARKLMDAAKEWAELNDVISIQLKSHDLLTRAHNFYEKQGFKSYGKVFELKL